MKKSNRRDFLVRSIQLSLTAATVSSFMPLQALAKGGRKKKYKANKPGTLVVIYLRGGCDALNVVIPYRDPRYMQIRPGIGIAAKGTGTEPGVVELSKQFGLHPSLEALYPLYESKQFAPIINVGSPHASRSHFDCQDFMEYAAPGDRSVKQGWLNRFQEISKPEAAEEAKRFRAVAMQGLLPRSLRGPHPVLAVPPIREGGDRDPLEIFDAIYPGMDGMPAEEGEGDPDLQDPVLMAGRVTIQKMRRFREITNKKFPGEAKYPSHALGTRLRQVARVIKGDAGLEVAAIDYPGWDHHIREGGHDGKMAQMLKVLGDSLAAFHKDLGERMENVCVLTMSEFGRTARENGNEGTDHGRGGMMLALGGMVQGGKVYGQWKGLEDSALQDKRDLPVTTDFRDVFGEALTEIFDFKLPRTFFPGYMQRKRLGLMKG